MSEFYTKDTDRYDEIRAAVGNYDYNREEMDEEDYYYSTSMREDY